MSHRLYQTTMDTLMPLFQEQWRTGASVRFSPRGISMLPMLRQGKDSVVLSPLPDSLSRYDLPLYQLENGRYILHRIVAVHEDHYTCMGDNLLAKETVYPGQMLAVVTAYYREGRRVEMASREHRFYCRMLLPCWRLYRRTRSSLGRIKRRLLK